MVPSGALSMERGPCKGAVSGAKVLAASIIECFKNPQVVEDAKASFQKEIEGTAYFSMLPPDQKPPLELNRAMMEKYRPQMQPHYLKEKPVFR